MPAPITSAQITDFPFGVRSFGMPVVGGGRIMTTGRVFFVDSTAGAKGDDVSHGTTPQTPFATIAFAITACNNNSGDVILVLPGHVESVITPAGINCSVAGVSIIGISYNEGRDRPIITLSTSVTASIDINAANVTIENVVIDMTGIDAIVAGINVKSSDFTLHNNELITATAAGQAVRAILTNGNAARLRVIDNFLNGTTDVGTLVDIDIDGLIAIPDVEIGYNRLIGDFGTSAIKVTAGILATGLWIHHNTIVTFGIGQRAIDTLTAANGIVAFNYAVGSDVAQLISTGLAAIENFGYATGSSNQVGQPIPVVGTALAANHSLVDQIIGNQMSARRENFFLVTADFTQLAWNTVGTHEVVHLTGSVPSVFRVRILPICSIDLIGGGTISFGTKKDTAAFIAGTTATAIDSTEIWLDTTPTSQYLISGKGTVPGKIIDALVASSLNSIGYEITVGALTNGVIIFAVWWEPLVNPDDLATAGTGTAL